MDQPSEQTPETASYIQHEASHEPAAHQLPLSDVAPEIPPEQIQSPIPIEVPGAPHEINGSLNGAVRGVTRFGPKAMLFSIGGGAVVMGAILMGIQGGQPAAPAAMPPLNTAPPVNSTRHTGHFGEGDPSQNDYTTVIAAPSPTSKPRVNVPNIQSTRPAEVVRQPIQNRALEAVPNIQQPVRDEAAEARMALEAAKRKEADSAVKSAILVNEAANSGGGQAVSRLIADNSGSPALGPAHAAGRGYLDGPNGQFAQDSDGSRSSDILPSQREAPITRYEVIASSVIPATLITAIDTDHPGIISALVRQNVYDSLTGRYLLIPQGSRLIGVYEASVHHGQSRVTVAWNRLIFPDTSSIDLLNMVGADVQGTAGFGGKVDNHFGDLIKATMLSTILAVGTAQAAPQTGSILQAASSASTAAQAAAQQIQQVGSKIVSDASSIPPTIHVTRGYPCNVIVDRDITFRAPYSPQI